jgi:hypothetical protein
MPTELGGQFHRASHDLFSLPERSQMPVLFREAVPNCLCFARGVPGQGNVNGGTAFAFAKCRDIAWIQCVQPTPFVPTIASEAMSGDAVQRVVKVRREHKSGVVRETIKDGARRFTAHGFRKWSEWRVAETAFGAILFGVGGPGRGLGL